MARFVAPLHSGSSRPLEDSEALQASSSSIDPRGESNDFRKRPPIHPSLSSAPPPVLPVRPPPNPLPRPEDSSAAADVQADVEEDLSEEQLRNLYEDEEIDRFLNVFSAYVTEVRLPEQPGSRGIQTKTMQTVSVQEEDMSMEAESSLPEDGEWVRVSTSPVSQEALPPLPPRPVSVNQDRCFSEEIAMKYIIPILPPPRAPPPAFTLGRLRLATQRLYLAVEPTYKHFLLGIWRLATWQERRTSALYCIIFWILWYCNFLLPFLFLRILYALASHKLFPYPSLDELRRRRREVGRARAFGKEVEARLSTPSSFALNEVWQFFKIISMSRKKKTKVSKKKEKATVEGPVVTTEEQEEVDEKLVEAEERTVVVEDSKKREEVQDIKRTVLFALDEISDIHERVRNIFLWRLPVASWIFAAILVALFLVTAFVPAKYLAKMVYAVGGFFFWHVVPVIASISSADRARFPPPLSDVPTDADYAMQLISQRIARGLDVRPSNKRKSSSASASGSRMGISELGSTTGTLNERSGQDEKDNNINWKKWSHRAAMGKTFIEGGKRLMTGKEPLHSASWPPLAPLIPGIAFAHSAPEGHIETHTYPAQHGKGPGLITLTSTTFFFTPLMSSTAKITVGLQDIRGVKRAGPMKGLNILWVDASPQASEEEREDKFRWVGARDELFARLVGWQGQRWLRV